MANPRKPPRLYLRRRRHRRPLWVILDGGYEQALCLREDQRQEAEEALRQYSETTGVSRVPEHDLRGYIYFITADAPSFPIKIGFSRGATPARMDTLQGGCPYPLVALGTMRGTMAEERALHRRFSRWRMTGEWFARNSDLLEYIRSVTTIESEIINQTARKETP